MIREQQINIKTTKEREKIFVRRRRKERKRYFESKERKKTLDEELKLNIEKSKINCDKKIEKFNTLLFKQKKKWRDVFKFKILSNYEKKDP